MQFAHNGCYKGSNPFDLKMVDDKLVRRSLWVGDIQRVRVAPTIYINYIILFLIKQSIGVMAEWLMRGTVNTFFRGSIPLDTLNLKTKKVKFIEAVAPAPPSEGGWRSPAARQT